MPPLSEELLKAIMDYNRKYSIATEENEKIDLDKFISYVKN